MNHPRLLVVVGPTASGKSGLGLELASRLDGEIVSADAFAVYRGLDIGTAKPTREERRRVPHHLIDVARPTERFSAGDFVRAADRAVADIARRGRVPVVVGGTHFYVRALLLGLFPSPPRDDEVRRRLTAAWDRDPAALYRRLAEVDPPAATSIGPTDAQRIVRALEVLELTGRPISEHWEEHDARPRYAALLVAPDRPRDHLYARIETRVERMYAKGLVEEVRDLLHGGVPESSHAMRAIGYRQTVEHLQGRLGLDQAIEQTKIRTRQLAKRQLTWIRHMHEGTVTWVPPVEEGGAGTVLELWGRRRGEGRTA